MSNKTSATRETYLREINELLSIADNRRLCFILQFLRGYLNNQ